MEKDNAGKTAEGQDTPGANRRNRFYDHCKSCCSGKDIAGKKPGNWKNLCKEMPDPKAMKELMRTCFSGDQNTA